MRKAVGRGEGGVGDPDAPAHDGTSAGADEQRARLPHQPRPQPARLENQARAREKVARVMPHEVAQ